MYNKILLLIIPFILSSCNFYVNEPDYGKNDQYNVNRTTNTTSSSRRGSDNYIHFVRTSEDKEPGYIYILMVKNMAMLKQSTLVNIQITHKIHCKINKGNNLLIDPKIN